MIVYVFQCGSKIQMLKTEPCGTPRNTLEESDMLNVFMDTEASIWKVIKMVWLPAERFNWTKAEDSSVSELAVFGYEMNENQLVCT